MKRVATTFDVVNGVTGGRLESRLRQLRREGLTFELIAERLRTEFNMPATTTTVYRWWKALEDDQGAA